MKKRYGLASLVLVCLLGVCIGLLAGQGLDLSPGPARAAFGDQDRAGKVSLEWQEIKSNITRTLHRAPVPGGWLVAQQDGLAFIPDPNHEW